MILRNEAERVIEEYTQPVLVDEVHFADPHFDSHRICDLEREEGITNDFDDVTCQYCRIRGAIMYGW